MEIAFAALGASDVDTVVAALSVLRTWVPQETGTRLLEAITAIAVDRDRDARVRVAALDALSDLPDDLVRPIRDQAPPPEAAGPALDNPVPRANGWKRMAHERRSPRCTTRSSRFATQRTVRRQAANERVAQGTRCRAPRTCCSWEPPCAVRRARDLQHGEGSAAPGIYRDDCGPWRRELPRATRARLVRDARRRLASSVVRGGATNRDAVEAWRAPCRRERHSRELVGVYLGSARASDSARFYLSTRSDARRERLAVDEDFDGVFARRETARVLDVELGGRVIAVADVLASPRSPVVRQSANAHQSFLCLDRRSAPTRTSCRQA